MPTTRPFLAHVVTMAVTLVLATVLLGDSLRFWHRPDRLILRPQPSPPTVAATAPAPGSTEAKLPAPIEEYNPPNVAPPAIDPEILKQSDADEQINVSVYAAVNKSVVNITTASVAIGLFGAEQSSSGTASGFVIDKQGHILTNYHVIEGADAIQVTLFDGSTHKARLIGQDASNDVAVVQIQTSSDRLFPISLGDSSHLLVGQKVLALGNPFGLERTLTTGIISSLDRSIRAKNGRMIKGIIQTDAAVNPGNSGGPLLNSRGQVIGMNTAILSEVGQSAGISFAVPINTIQRILKPLIEHGRVIRADLGIARVYTTGRGLLVLELTEGGPAQQAGIRPIQVKVVQYGPARVQRLDPDSADLIVAIDHKRVLNVDELLTEVEKHSPGAVVRVTVVRDGQPMDIPVQLGQS
jgi:S1-C subfamily serine protease